MDKAFAYICASAETAPRILKRYCRTVYELGYVPICPPLSDTQYLSDESPDELRDLHSIALQKLARWWSAAKKSVTGCRWRSALLKSAISSAPLSQVSPRSRKTWMGPPSKGQPYFSQGVAVFASIAFGYPNAPFLGRTPNPRQPSPQCSH